MFCTNRTYLYWYICFILFCFNVDSVGRTVVPSVSSSELSSTIGFAKIVSDKNMEEEPSAIDMLSLPPKPGKTSSEQSLHKIILS